MRSECEHFQPLVSGLEGARHARRDSDEVTLSELEDLVVELHPARSGNHEVDLFRLYVPVAETLPLAGLEAMVGEAGVRCIEVVAGEARLLAVRDTEPRGGVGDLVDVLVRERRHRATSHFILLRPLRKCACACGR